MRRLELRTSWLTVRRANQLRHTTSIDVNPLGYQNVTSKQNHPWTGYPRTMLSDGKAPRFDPRVNRFPFWSYRYHNKINERTAVSPMTFVSAMEICMPMVRKTFHALNKSGVSNSQDVGKKWSPLFYSWITPTKSVYLLLHVYFFSVDCNERVTFPNGWLPINLGGTFSPASRSNNHVTQKPSTKPEAFVLGSTVCRGAFTAIRIT